jgi:hypothetical protein
MIGLFYLIRIFHHPSPDTIKPFVGAILSGGVLCAFFSEQLIHWLPIHHKTQDKKIRTIVGWAMFSFVVLSFYHLKEIWQEQTHEQMMFLAVSFGVGFSKAFVGKVN